MSKKVATKKSKNNYYFPTLSIIMLTFALILSNVVVYFNFNLFGYSIVTSIVTFPFVYFFVNLILKKSNLKTASFAVITSIIAQSLVFIITHFLTATELDLYNCFGALISYTITIFINLFLYQKFVIKDNNNFLKTILIYVGVIILDSILYMLIINKGFPSDLGMVFLISTGIKTLIGVILAFFEFCLKHEQR